MKYVSPARILFVACMTLVTVAYAAIKSEIAFAQTQPELKIGVLGPMSGASAQWGVELSRGAQMRADEINAKGGVDLDGKRVKITIIPYDHKGDAAEARTAANRLV